MIVQCFGEPSEVLNSTLIESNDGENLEDVLPQPVLSQIPNPIPANGTPPCHFTTGGDVGPASPYYVKFAYDFVTKTPNHQIEPFALTFDTPNLADVPCILTDKLYITVSQDPFVPRRVTRSMTREQQFYDFLAPDTHVPAPNTPVLQHSSLPNETITVQSEPSETSIQYELREEPSLRFVANVGVSTTMSNFYIAVHRPGALKKRKVLVHRPAFKPLEQENSWQDDWSSNSEVSSLNDPDYIPIMLDNNEAESRDMNDYIVSDSDGEIDSDDEVEKNDFYRNYNPETDKGKGKLYNAFRR